jgi:hypothetical protein
MRAFMAGRRKKKNDVPDNSEGDEIRGHDAGKTRTAADNVQALIPRGSIGDATNFRRRHLLSRCRSVC